MIDYADLEYLINKSYLWSDESRRENDDGWRFCFITLAYYIYLNERKHKALKCVYGRTEKFRVALCQESILTELICLFPVAVAEIKYKHPCRAKEYPTYHPRNIPRFFRVSVIYSLITNTHFLQICFRKIQSLLFLVNFKRVVPPGVWDVGPRRGENRVKSVGGDGR